jgi:hypothetical protein
MHFKFIMLAFKLFHLNFKNIKFVCKTVTYKMQSFNIYKPKCGTMHMFGIIKIYLLPVNVKGVKVGCAK